MILGIKCHSMKHTSHFLLACFSWEIIKIFNETFMDVLNVTKKIRIPDYNGWETCFLVFFVFSSYLERILSSNYLTLNCSTISNFFIAAVFGLDIARISSVIQCEYIPSMAMSSFFHELPCSYLHLLPPQNIEHCISLGAFRLKLSPT